MKKIVSILLAVSILCSMALTATAAENAGDLPVKNYAYSAFVITVDNSTTPLSYSNVQKASEGFALVCREDGKWWYTNESGKIQNCRHTMYDSNIEGFDYAAPYKEGKAIAGIKNGEEFELGFVNKNKEFTYFKDANGITFKAPKELYFDDNRDIKAYQYNNGFVCLPVADGKYVAFGEDGSFFADSFKKNGNTYHIQDVYSEGCFICKTADGEVSIFGLPFDMETSDYENEKYNASKYIERIVLGTDFAGKTGKYKIEEVLPYVDGKACIILNDDSGRGGVALISDKADNNGGKQKPNVLAEIPCKNVGFGYIAGSAGKKVINDDIIVYKDFNDKYRIYNTNSRKEIEGKVFSDLSIPVNGAMIGKVDEKGYRILDTAGDPIVEDYFDSGKIFSDGTIRMEKDGVKNFYEYDGNKLCKVNLTNVNASLANFYCGDAGRAGEDRFIYISMVGNKYGYGKLTPVKEAAETGNNEDETNKGDNVQLDGQQPNEETKQEEEKQMNFTDVPADEWYYADLKSAFEAGLINGKTANEFKPNDNMTFAEAIKLAACLHQQNAEGKVTLTNGNPWYQPYVDYCKENGIIERNYPDYNAPAGRAGYMMIFAKALPDDNLVEINSVENNSIPDVKTTDIYGHSVYKLYRAGIVGGSDTSHNCKPDDNIKRSEVATILARMMFPEKRIRFTLPEYIIGDSDETKTVKKGIDVSVTVHVKNGQKYEWQKKDGEDWAGITEENQTTYKNTSTETLVVTKIEEDITVRCNVFDNDGKLLVTSKTITIKVLDQ